MPSAPCCKVARVPLPAFDEAARAGDIFKEEAEAAVLGMKTPEAAMAAVVAAGEAVAAGVRRRWRGKPRCISARAAPARGH